MCFTNPALKACALSRPRSLVSVPLRLANAQLARGRPNRAHTGNGRFLHRPQKMPPPVFRGPARCRLPMRAGIALGRLGFPPAPPAQIVPESLNPGWGAPSRPCAHFCAILGAFAAAHTVPKKCTAAGNSVKSSDINMLGNITSIYCINVTSKRHIPSPATASQASSGGRTHQHPRPHPMHPASKPAYHMPRPEPLLSLVPSTSPSSWCIHGRHVSITPELEAHVRDRLARTLHTLQSADVLESEGGVSEVDVRLMNSQVGGSECTASTRAAARESLCTAYTNSSTLIAARDSVCPANTHSSTLHRPTSRCTPASSTSTCMTPTCSGGPSRARPMDMQMPSPTLRW